MSEGLATKRSVCWIEPPILQPANLYLELIGEDLRARAFMASQGDDDVCLRPDMTAPALREALAMPIWQDGECIAYKGPVFRRQPPGSEKESEFLQFGAEWFFPAEQNATHETEIFDTAMGACRASRVEPHITLGDVALLHALIDAVAPSAQLAGVLKRALRRSGDARAALAQFDTPDAPPTPLATVLARLPADDGEALVRDWLDGAGVALVGARPAAEIAARLRQKAEEAGAPRLAPAEKTFLLEALSHQSAPDALIKTMQTLAKRPVVRHPVVLETALARFAARWEAFKPIAADAPVTASLQFGRGLAYYDGFVFELEAPHLGARASLGGGGRYDGLLAAMAKALGGGPRVASSWGAAGFAMRPARLEEAGA